MAGAATAMMAMMAVLTGLGLSSSTSMVAHRARPGREETTTTSRGGPARRGSRAASSRRDEDLALVCGDLAGYMKILQDLLPEQTRAPGGGPPGMQSRQADAPEPWNPAVGGAYMAAHAGVRQIEQTLRLRVTGRAAPRRGGSDGNTAQALEVIPKLAAALSEAEVAQVTAALKRWVLQAKTVPGIDEAQRWRPLPAFRCEAHGVRGCRVCATDPRDVLPPRCPYCRCYQLRADLDTGVVACFLPGCRDSDGAPPVAAMGTAEDGRPQITWGDGRVEVVDLPHKPAS